MSEPSEADLDRMRQRIAGLARQLEPADTERFAPPADLWMRISASIEHDGVAAVPAAHTARAAHQRRHVPRPRSRWRPRRVATVVAMAAAAAIAALVVVRGGPADRGASAALSSRGLSPSAAASSGRAQVTRDTAGFTLQLDLDAPPTRAGSFLEVWMIDEEIDDMVSLGPYRGDGRYAIPDGVDPDGFPIVDVSIEPIDGVAAHSGESAVRGVLR